MYPTLCIYIFWKCIYSWRGFVIANAPMLCMTYALIFQASMLFLYIYFHARSWNGQCIPWQNSSWFCLAQDKLSTHRECWGFMPDVVWERTDHVFWTGLRSPWQAMSLKSARFHKVEHICEANMISLILFSYPLLQPRHATHSANVRCGLSGAVTVSRKSSAHRIYLEGRLQRDSTQNLADLKPPMLNDKKPQPKTFKDG